MTSVFVSFFLRGSSCCGRIRRLERQRSQIGQQASSDKTCLEQNKSPALLCRNIARPLWSPRSFLPRLQESPPHIFRCLSRNQSPVRCGGSFLRTGPGYSQINYLTTPSEGLEVLPALQVSTLNRSLTPYTCSRLSALMNNALRCCPISWG